MAERKGFKVLRGKRAALLLKMISKKIPPEVLGGAKIKGIDWNGSIDMGYKDMGDVSKFFIGNTQYFDWLKSNSPPHLQLALNALIP